MLAHIRFENTEVGHWNELGWLGDHSLAAGRDPYQAVTPVQASWHRQLRQSIACGETTLPSLDEADLMPDGEDVPESAQAWSAA